MSERAREAAARAATGACLAGEYVSSSVVDAAIDAFLAALKADGYKLVRREATEEMVDAYVSDAHGKTFADVAKAGWSAMWDAAPEAGQ